MCWQGMQKLIDRTILWATSYRFIWWIPLPVEGGSLHRTSFSRCQNTWGVWWRKVWCSFHLERKGMCRVRRFFNYHRCCLHRHPVAFMIILCIENQTLQPNYQQIYCITNKFIVAWTPWEQSIRMALSSMDRRCENTVSLFLNSKISTVCLFSTSSISHSHSRCSHTDFILRKPIFLIFSRILRSMSDSE
jgi:hypothetical protein